MKEGAAGGSLKVLTSDDLESIHRASLDLLLDPGIYSSSDLILSTFKDSGAAVDQATRMIRINPDLVETALKKAPSSFVLHGRDPAMDVRLEPGRVYFAMGGASEPFIWDYDVGGPRPPTKEDMVRCTQVAQSLPNVDIVMALCSAGDVPEEQVFLHEYDAIFRNTNKPVAYTAPGRFYASKFLEMAAAACGGEEQLRHRPWVMAFVTPASPLQVTPLDECLFEFAGFGVPAICGSGAMVGATSPATLAGHIAQANAETLFVITLAQIIQPGHPVVYAGGVPVMDMSTAQCTYGSAEQSLGRAATAQLARFYNLPSFATAATEAKLPDAAAATETMTGMLMSSLAGMTISQTMGTLASGMYGAVEMLIICDEMANMIKRILKGINVTEATLAVDIIREIGPRGQFLTHEHTANVFRDELFFPSLFRRESIDDWRERGGKSIVDVAHERTLDILENAAPLTLPEGADKALEAALERGIKETSLV